MWISRQPGEQAGGQALFCVGELITNTPDGEYQLRIVGIVFNLGAQPIDMRINRSVVTFIRIIPDFLEQVLARENASRSEEHTSELQSRPHLVCRLLLEKKKKTDFQNIVERQR